MHPTDPGRSGWLSGSLLLMTIGGVLIVLSSPAGGEVPGLWPAGLASASLILAGRHRLAVVAPLIGVLATASFLIGGLSFGISISFGLGVLIEALIVWRVMVREDAPESLPPLRTDADLRRFLGAILLASAVGAVVAGAAAFLFLDNRWWFVGLTVGVSHLATHIVVVPFATRLVTYDAPAGVPERTLLTGILAVLALVVFLTEGLPVLVLVVVPLLVWSATRCAPRVALVYLVLVLVLAVLVTGLERGPFVAMALSSQDQPGDAEMLALGVFALVCGSIVLPLLLRVGHEIAAAAVATAERDLLQHVLDGTRDAATIVTDAAGVITRFPAGAVAVLGHSSEQMVGRHVSALLSESSLRDKISDLGVDHDLRSMMAGLLASPRKGAVVRLLTADGRKRDHRITVGRLQDHRGADSGFVLTIDDITDRLESHRTMEEAVDRMTRLDGLKDTFISGVSHELRTPVASMIGYLELLDDGDFGVLLPAQSKVVQRVASNGERLLGLLDELLALSRLESAAPMTMKWVDLSVVVREGAYDLGPAATAAGLTMEISGVEDPVWVRGDRDMLRRVVGNLGQNAIKFTPAPGRIDVHVAEEDGVASIAVTDTGMGIARDEQDQLFTRFFRSSAALDQAIPGSGLGLTICEAIMARHGGGIVVESEEGEGSTFLAWIPLRKPTGAAARVDVGAGDPGEP